MRKLLVIAAATATLGLGIPATAAAAPPQGPWPIPSGPCDYIGPNSLECLLITILTTGSANTGSAETLSAG
ncbi:hypothetical protein [Rhodococcus artemisiae]|uniref:Uncharacterized protein n=1 Tax=Rhodococcus artemisiae TaxID=714159 RepID=A0ABU7LGI7_9NOCA|nr:hypothetical protein [Rhodococcus artemisiae]MEE2060664.1 hypothetical protein [Rhodococcus artemisiae]